MDRTGRCLCGAVQYSLRGEPIVTAICHCKNCQRQAGSAFSIMALAKTDRVEITGDLKTYSDTADSGAVVERKFCPNCGSAMFSVKAETPELTIIKAGTFDDVSWLKPITQVWCKSAQPWVEIGGDIRAFEEGAPAR